MGTIVLFAAAAAPVGAWFRGGNPIGFGDTGLMWFLYEPSYLAKVFRFTWFAAPLTGYPSATSPALLPVVTVFAALERLHIPVFLRQAIVFGAIQLSSIVLFWKLAQRLLEGEVCRHLAAMAAALFYAYNTVTMINYWYSGILAIYMLPFVPALLLATDAAARRFHWGVAFILAVIVSAWSVVFVNPAFALPVVALAVLLWVYRTAQCIRRWTDAVIAALRAGMLAVIVAMASGWFVAPLLVGAGTQYEMSTTMLNPRATLEVVSASASLIGLLRGLPIVPQSTIWAYKDPAWRWAYNAAPFTVIGTLLLGIIVLPLLGIGRGRGASAVLFAAGVWLIGIWLSLGLAAPIGSIFGILFDHVPFFSIFRSPIGKFAPLVVTGAALLFGIGVARLYATLRGLCTRNWVGLSVAGILATAIGVYAYPMWTGEVVRSPVVIRGVPISSEIDVPPGYEDVARFLARQPGEFRVLALPLRPSAYVHMEWAKGYDGPDYTWLLFRAGTIAALFDGYFPSSRVLAVAAEEGTAEVLHAAGQMGARYVAIQKDIDPVRGNYSGRRLQDPTEITQELASLGMAPVLSNASVDLYPIADSDVRPLLYVADPLGLRWHPSPFQTANNDSNLYHEPRVVHVERRSPAKWVAHIQGATSPFALVLSETFNTDWKVFVAPGSRGPTTPVCPQAVYARCGADNQWLFEPQDVMLLGRPSLSEAQHAMVNEFGNGWYIDPRQFDAEDLTITIYYLPQSWFYGGVLASVATWIAGAVILLCYSVGRVAVRPRQGTQSRPDIRGGSRLNGRL